MTIRWTKLPDDSFGVCGAMPPPARGEVVTATSRDGRETRVAIDRVRVDQRGWRASILRENGRPMQLEAS